MEEADTTAQERIWIEGRREGIVQAKSETLKRQVTETFGPLPRELEAHIDEQPEEVLDEYLDCLLSDVMCVSVKKGFALEERMQERFDELDLGVRRYLLGDCVDTLFDLTREQEARFKVRCVRDEFRGVRRMMARFYRKFRDEGRKEGELAGRREPLKRHIRTKFGSLSEETVAFVDTVRTKERLNRYLDRVLTEKTLDALGFETEARWARHSKVVP